MPAERLHPFDVVLALRLARQAGTLSDLAKDLSVVPSQVHAAVNRLEFAGLIRPGSRETNRHALAEFIEHGVRYAFPVMPDAETTGVPTAHSAEPLSSEIDASDAFVWPTAKARDAVRGRGIVPLYGAAPKLRESDPETYRLVALVDAVRAGSPRERSLAIGHLRRALRMDDAAF